MCAMPNEMSLAMSYLSKYPMVGVFITSSYDWQMFGELCWSEMMNSIRSKPTYQRVMGVDAEWFMRSPLSVVQVATATHWFVIHLSYLNGRELPQCVKDAFECPSIIKCGVGISGDVKRFSEEQGLQLQCILNLETFSIFFELAAAGSTNLKDLAHTVADMNIEKSKKITRSNWELPLSPENVIYAAEDAIASYCIGERVMAKAASVSQMDREYNVNEWLKRVSPLAASSFKTALREHSQAGAPKTKERVDEAKKSDSWKSIRVQVISKNGDPLFQCSPARAKFYTLDEQIARITKVSEIGHNRIEEIQLLFDPQAKTRLCVHHSIGFCDMNDSCPFAHGVEDLREDAKKLLDSTTPSCAACLGTRNLMRRFFVPPSMRKHLPEPLNKVNEMEDSLLICLQCHSTLLCRFDMEMSSIYDAAKEADPTLKNLMAVLGKSISYSRLLSDPKKVQAVPVERQNELRAFITTNWELLHFEKLNPTFSIPDPFLLNDEILNHLKNVVPGAVRARLTVESLVGNDLDKAFAFVQHWRDFYFQTCGLIDKPSNRVSADNYKSLNITTSNAKYENFDL